jgi:hypothetical protein
MASLPARDPVQFAGVRSVDRDLLRENIASTVKTEGDPP